MMLRVGDLVVRSDDPGASEGFARAAASILAWQWPDDRKETDPVELVAEHTGGRSVHYVVTLEPCA